MSSMTAAERAATRRRRRLIMFVTLPGVVIGTLGLGTAYAENWLVPKTESSCVGEVVKVPSPKTFKVNILNATYRAGEAGVAAKSVVRHGFQVGTVGNDDAMRTIYGVGEIRYGAKGLDQALYVQKALLTKARLVLDDDRAGTDVDLVLGRDYTQLEPLPPRPPAQAGKTVVNVYNTTYYEGLGKKVSDELVRRGFQRGEVSAPPDGYWERQVAQIRYGEDGDLAAKLVQQHFPGSTLQLDKSLKGATVSVYLGMLLTDVSKMTPLDKVPVQPKYVPPAWPTVIRPCE